MNTAAALIFFVFAGLFSPGPNVVMLTTSGARFGFRATVPHLLGVPVGTGLLAAASTLGVGTVLFAAPGLKLALQILAALWIVYLAWGMAQAGRVGRAAGLGKPFTFVQAVLFQAVNPKVWAIALAAAAGFASGRPPAAEALWFFCVFAGINLSVGVFWTTAGHLLAGVLQADRVWRGFMVGMAGLMAFSAVLIFL